MVTFMIATFVLVKIVHPQEVLFNSAVADLSDIGKYLKLVLCHHHCLIGNNRHSDISPCNRIPIQLGPNHVYVIISGVIVSHRHHTSIFAKLRPSPSSSFRWRELSLNFNSDHPATRENLFPG